jgi:hypothetical protein
MVTGWNVALAVVIVIGVNVFWLGMLSIMGFCDEIENSIKRITEAIALYIEARAVAVQQKTRKE